MGLPRTRYPPLVMLCFVRASVLAAAVATGCSSSPAVPTDAGPMSDGATAETRRLTLQTEPTITLLAGEETTIRVRYADASGAVLGREPVRFVLDGVAHDSTLARLDARTDATGTAEATLVAGATAAAFRVRVSAAAATPISIEVAVSDAGFGELEVELAYEGSREDGLLAAAVFAEARCDDPRAQSERGDRYRLRGPDDEDVAFVGLPAGLRYAVVGRYEGASGLVGWGCVDGVGLSSDGLTRVRVPVEDLPLLLDGEFDAAVAFDAPETAAAAAEELHDFGASYLTPDAATLLLDAMARQLGTDDAALRTLTLAREGDLDARYQAALDDAGLGPDRALETVAGLVASRLARLELGGTWTHVGGEAAVRFVRLRAGVDEVTEASLGSAFALQGTGALEASGRVGPIRVSLPLDRVVAHVLTTEASARGLTRREEYVVASAECAAMPALPEVDVCDADCREAACREVTTLLWGALDLHLSVITASRTTLTLEGTLELLEETGDREIDAVGGELGGSWGSTVATLPESLRVTVEATRVIP